MPNVIGIGTDIVECLRIAQMIERHGEMFISRVYTDYEIQYCQARKSATQHFAGRWAAKEAISKVLGLGVRGVGWREIEILPNFAGAPQVTLHGRAARRAEAMDLDEVTVSISHERHMAVAVAVAHRRHT
jgi:holo-[acyl-carrier protein] synthase